jgi:predicted nucleic acid-binding protein
VRVVLDTNVLLAAIATHGLCQALVTLVFRDHVVMLSEHILGGAIAGSEAVLVTGDQELLVLGLFRGVAILSPRDFYERLRG